MTVLTVIFRTGTDKMLRSFNSARSAFAGSTTVGVVYKHLFKNGIDVIVNQVMNYSVSKVGSENLPLYRPEGYKAQTWTYLVFSAFYLSVKLKNLFFVVNFKRQGVYGITLVFPGAVIGPE